jgi:uncharacterized protein (TIGR03435 family)
MDLWIKLGLRMLYLRLLGLHKKIDWAMTVARAGTILALLICHGASGQPATTEPVEAGIHRSAKTAERRMRTISATRGQYEVRSASLVDLIGVGYDVTPEQVVGGPSWLENDRFDIVITNQHVGTGPEALGPIVRSLLADRFKLAVHKDTKPISTYVLKPGKKVLLRPADNTGAANGCRLQSTAGPLPAGAVRAKVGGTPILFGPARTITYQCRNMTMAAFAQTLPGLLGVPTGSGAVVDQTGISGAWNFDVQWSYAPAGPPPRMEGWVSVFEALNQQIGLQLVREPVPTTVIVVDSVLEQPTPNPPSVAASLPVNSPAKFELAVIKPSTPGAQMPRFEVQPGGRFVVQGIQLSALVNRALHEVSNDPVVGLPAWAGSAFFDITAQTPRDSPVPETDAIGPMLRALLVERFKLATHPERQPVSIYQLVTMKHKLKQADPQNRSRCTSLPADPGIPPALSKSIVCQNTTMAQFAAQLRFLAGPDIGLRVEDGTGLTGAWDFTLSFSSHRMLRSGGGAADGQTPPSAPDPNGAVTIFDALQKQLGLKLETSKRLLPVIVVDHLERTPTEN